MVDRIAKLEALEILDSRGNPTVQVTVHLDSGITGTAAVPSGASTSESEALELRDGDPKRYGGKGVLKAVHNVAVEISAHLKGHDPRDQGLIDNLLIELDGTPNKSRLGANATLGASMAVARAGARASGVHLYQHLAIRPPARLPVPMMNVLNGGLHADNALDFQEFMLVPLGAVTFAEALRYGAETFHALKAILRDRGLSTAVGDEGGFAPDLESQDQACELIVEAIEKAGYRPGADIAIALDPAASSFGTQAGYDLKQSGAGMLTSEQLVALYQNWVEKYPIVSIEDGLGEHDWDGFASLTRLLGDRIQLVGDDLYATNPKLIRQGIAKRATNAVLIKLNQIGTVSESAEAIATCRSAGWGFVVSHRSGETDDPFMADFAVAMGAPQIKAGSASRGERLAKYNRLLQIEKELGAAALFNRNLQPLNTGRAA